MPNRDFVYFARCADRCVRKLCNVKSMDDNCGEWVECMGVASGCGYQEVGCG